MIQLVGALETLWSSHEKEWAKRLSAEGEFPDSQVRSRSLQAHERMISLIEAGDADGVSRLAREHVQGTVFYAVSGDKALRVDASAVR
jgi:DNA-binding GntR family transcriptional regulator